MKQFLCALFCACASSQIMAQTTGLGHIDIGYADDPSISIPKDFSFTNQPLLVLQNYNEEQSINIYDENLILLKTVIPLYNEQFSYTRYYKDQERSVSSVSIQAESTTPYEKDFNAFVENMKMTEPAFDESCLIINRQENGDSIVSFNYDWLNYQTNEQMYFGYELFQFKYPTYYLVFSKNGNTVHRCAYTATYTDWQTVGTHQEEDTCPFNTIKLGYVNLNNSIENNNFYFTVSQTLFNQDKEFEYLIPKYAIRESNGDVNTGEVVGPSEVNQLEDLKRTVEDDEQGKPAITGFQVVAANGTVVKDLLFDEGFTAAIYNPYALVIVMGTNTYLAFDGYKNHERCTVFYKIDRFSNSIKKVQTTPGTMRIQPTIANKHATIHVNFGDNNVQSSSLTVSTVGGKMLQSVPVAAGQVSTQLQASGQAGMYIITRMQGNTAKETRKIIVK